MKIPLYKIFWDESDAEAVAGAVRKGTDWAIGPNIAEFEGIVSEYLGRKYCVAFNSGTSALHAALLALDVGSGTEVIVPSFTFIATANSALFVGAKPVFADIEADTYGLDPRSVENAITKKTRAVIPIHYGGGACKIEELRAIADRHGLALVEDAAESLGASTSGGKVGSFGDVAILSFCGNKVMTCGEGGMATTDSRDTYERLKLVRSHGRLETENYFTSAKIFDYMTLGYNWRMSNITAALAISQFRKLDRMAGMRRAHAEVMSKQLSQSPVITTPTAVGHEQNVYQMYTIRLKNNRLREGLRNHLAEREISAKVYFDPVHRTIYYQKLGFQDTFLPITDRLSKEVLTLPIYPSMTSEESNYVVSNVLEYVNQSNAAEEEMTVANASRR